MGKYRFFFRDLDEITSRNRRVGARFGQLMRRGEAGIRALADGLVATRAMVASENERAMLARNVALVATYWMSYQRIGRMNPPTGTGDAEQPDPGQAAAQVLALIAPFLVGDARRLVERLSGDYL
jgi:hypothetical protein